MVTPIFDPYLNYEHEVPSFQISANEKEKILKRFFFLTFPKILICLILIQYFLVVYVCRCVILSATFHSLSVIQLRFIVPIPPPLFWSQSPKPPYPPLTSTLHPPFPPPLSPKQVWWPAWPPEPFHVVISLASLGQSPYSSNPLVSGYLHRLQLQASTSSMCLLCHQHCHILSTLLLSH